jgi:hypothetical protein
MQGKIRCTVKEYKIKQWILEPYSGWQNFAKTAFCEIKRGIKRARKDDGQLLRPRQTTKGRKLLSLWEF